MASSRSSSILAAAAAAAAAGVSIGIVMIALRRKKAYETASKLTSQMVESGVKVGDAASTTEKLAAIIRRGNAQLRVTADFDRTITSGASVSAHGVLETSEFLSKSFRDKGKELFEKFYPIECDPSISIHEKTPLMKEWYATNHANMLEEGLDRNHIIKAVQSAGDELIMRDGVDRVIDTLQSHAIPLLVFSAGLGDVIDECLRQRLSFDLTDTTQVVSNRMVFDEAGRVVGFKDPLIHMFNKSEEALAGEMGDNEEQQEVLKRKSVILMGDGIGDTTMGDGGPFPPSTILKIGFCNKDLSKNLSTYMDQFDCVVVGDGSMAPVLGLLEGVLAN